MNDIYSLTVGGQTKAAEKSRREEIEAEKKRIREVCIPFYHIPT